MRVIRRRPGSLASAPPPCEGPTDRRQREGGRRMMPAARFLSGSSRTRRIAATALAVCGLTLLGAAPGWANGGIAWHDCGPEQPPNLQCGELSVPLDYDHPDGAKITLGFNRLPAADTAHRVGSLIVNPGRTGRRRQPGHRRGGGGPPSLEPRPPRALRHDRHGPAWRRHEHTDPVRPRRLQPAGRRCSPARRRSSTSSRHGRARSVRAASTAPARCSDTWTPAAPHATWRRCARRSATAS